MKLLVSAFEHSSNLHLAEVKKRLPSDVEFSGIFDASLGEPLVDLRRLAIMGFVDALKKLPFFFRLADRMLDLAADADKVLLMDASGFNLPLAKKLKKRYPDKPIVYYILPQAWAWKRRRIGVLTRTVDTLASILPFERGYYPPDAPITYVGHPLLDEITRFNDRDSSEIRRVVFMPGSRRGEIRRLMPVFAEVRAALDVDEALLVVPEHFAKEDLNELYGTLSPFIVTHDAHAALASADFAFICSGTATLEASLIGTPLVLAYVAKPLDYFLARSLVKLDFIGLANIMFEYVAQRPLHAELIQDEVTPEALLAAMHDTDRAAFAQDAAALRAYLGHGSAENVARILMQKE